MKVNIEDCFNAIMSSTYNAIIVEDLNLSIKYWNKGAAAMYGYTAQEAIGQSINMIIPADKKYQLPHIVMQFTNNGTIENFITQRKAKNGRIIDISLTIVPVLDSENNLTNIISMSREITEHLKQQKKLESKNRTLKSLVKSLQLHRELFLHASDGFVVANSTGHIWDANLSFLASSGYTLSELKGKDVRILKSERHSDEFYSQIMKAVQTAGAWKGEMWNKRKNGSSYMESVSIGVIKNKQTSTVKWYCAITRDLTERLEYESQLYH